MPSVIGHAVVAGALGQMADRELRQDWRFWYMAILCSTFPDVDVVAFSLGIPYGAFWGHRGFLHSLTFAAVFGLIAAQRFRWLKASQRLGLAMLLVLITASHGVLDMLTNGGLGIAIFSPFNRQRYFFPWQPIEVSPIGLRHFMSLRGVAVLRSEALWVIMPSLAIGVALRVWKSK